MLPLLHSHKSVDAHAPPNTTTTMPGIPLPSPPLRPNTSAVQGPPQHILLLTASSCVGHVHLVVGRNALAASRAQKSLDAGALVTLVASAAANSHGCGHDDHDRDRDHDCADDLPYSLQQHVEAGEVRWLQRRLAVDSDLETLGRAEVGGVVDLVWLTGSPDDGTAPRGLYPERRVFVPVADSGQSG